MALVQARGTRPRQQRPALRARPDNACWRPGFNKPNSEALTVAPDEVPVGGPDFRCTLAFESGYYQCIDQGTSGPMCQVGGSLEDLRTVNPGHLTNGPNSLTEQVGV